MENSKRRRGISLSHHQSINAQTHPSLDRSVYVENQPTTRVQYTRYHLQSPSRRASAPKSKVRFEYPLHPSAVTSIRTPIRCTPSQERIYVPPSPVEFMIGAIPPNTYKPIQEIKQPRISQPLPPPVNIPQLEIQQIKQDQTAKSNQCIGNIDIPEKYCSFEECKQVIGRRLFGGASIVKKENILQQSDRTNRWMRTIKQESIIEKETEEQSNKQTYISETSIQQTVKQVVKVSETFQIPKKRQLNIQNEVVKLATQKVSSKENVPPIALAPISPPVKKEYRKARDPLKLQEMEKRLMQIIKICDQNLE